MERQTYDAQLIINSFLLMFFYFYFENRKDVPCRRVRRWAFSLKELLRDHAGREQFIKFLEKEFSAENLK